MLQERQRIDASPIPMAAAVSSSPAHDEIEINGVSASQRNDNNCEDNLDYFLGEVIVIFTC